MFRRSYIQNLLFSECPVLKKRDTAQKTPQEEAQDVAQETLQEARKTRHVEQKQTVVHRSRLRKAKRSTP